MVSVSNAIARIAPWHGTGHLSRTYGEEVENSFYCSLMRCPASMARQMQRASYFQGEGRKGDAIPND